MLKIIISITLFIVSFFGLLFKSKETKTEMTICSYENFEGANLKGNNSGINSSIETDPNLTYTLPTLTQNPQGQLVMYWTEKDPQNIMSLCFAVSKDGKTFEEKKTIITDAAVSSGRLMRPKLLFKKNGDIVAVFSYRTSPAMPPRDAKPAAPQAQGSNNNTMQAPPQGRPKRSSEIRFTVSKDGGNSWTSPSSIDTDTTKLTRGFFDAVLLANDEIAVAYLKDVKGSQKHEERDLRLAITKNGVFQSEKLIDPVVCDCCNISMVVDENGDLHMVYRDNNNDIRDMSHIVSKDNGQSFSAPKTLFADNWEIKGCPHAGATTVSINNEQYATWFSGTEKGQAGFRLANSSGQLLKVLDTKAKNTYISSNSKSGLWVWEQSSEANISSIYYSKIENGKLSASLKVADSDYGQNASIFQFDGKIVVAYEVLKSDKKTVLATNIVQ